MLSNHSHMPQLDIDPLVSVALIFCSEESAPGCNLAQRFPRSTGRLGREGLHRPALPRGTRRSTQQRPRCRRRAARGTSRLRGAGLRPPSAALRAAHDDTGDPDILPGHEPDTVYEGASGPSS